MKLIVSPRQLGLRSNMKANDVKVADRRGLTRVAVSSREPNDEFV